MPDQSLENRKDALIRALTDAYARGALDMDAFERAVTRVNACPDSAALAAEAAALGIGAEVVAVGASLPSPAPAVLQGGIEQRPEAIQLDCVSGNIRKSGDWVKAGSYRIRLKSSSARLDLRDYEGERGFRLLIDLDAVSSSLRLIVPEGFEVEDHFSERISSSVRNRPKGESYGDDVVMLIGYLRSSVVKVKYC